MQKIKPTKEQRREAEKIFKEVTAVLKNLSELRAEMNDFNARAFELESEKMEEELSKIMRNKASVLGKQIRPFYEITLPELKTVRDQKTPFRDQQAREKIMVAEGLIKSALSGISSDYTPLGSQEPFNSEQVTKRERKRKDDQRKIKRVACKKQQRGE